MATSYAIERRVDLGEHIHQRVEIEPVCDKNIPFKITSAQWALKTPAGTVVCRGDCEITGHVLDAFVWFKFPGLHYLWYTYEIGDETWVDKIKVRVG